ncbi:hypothetical protein C2S51_033870 [Perilla frutescens var. frutescens]|nr:hypothetical protein C2S51_033870 [Perilla frutescens var. frutescens]
MRSGGYTLHHSLTVEAAAIVKQAVSLARRRGHAQVTPLHVASAMLSSPAGLLKRACLQSHSHPLQCKALELCFNVALNRLPTSASTPLLGPQSHLPSLSNALVAAFKRAQAHQRRGSIENQQQPILALKVEIEQLVVSILDDPSVSRVMREAGFSSTQVKANVEQAVSMEKCTPHQPPAKEFMISSSSASTNTNTNTNTNLSQFRYNNSNNNNNSYSNSEVEGVLEAMADKQRKNAVIVGECAEANERVVRKVIEKFDKKDVPSEMKSVQFISVPLSTLRNVSKEEFEVKVGELRSLVKSYVGRGGVVLYLGDLDWVSELWSNHHHQRDDNHVHVEYMIMELSRLVCGENNIIDYYKQQQQQQQRLWLMGIATFQTYAKCKMGRPSLETLWSLNPLTLPLRTTLALGLTLHSGMHDQVVVKKEVVEDDDDGGNMRWVLRMKKQLVCCSDCSDNFKKEAEAVMVSSSSTSRLPSWLQQYKDDENRKRLGLHLNNNNINLQESDHDDKVKDLCKKWNSICRSVHKKPHFLEKVLNLSSSSTSPSPSTSVSSSDRNKSKIQQTLVNWPPIFEPTPDHQYEVEVSKPAAAKPELLSNPNSSPNSASSSEASQECIKLDDLMNSDSLAILTAALEKKVPWQKHIVPQIATPILKSRSGSIRRESWLFFLGPDQNGKEIMAKELAKLVFGSHDDFVAIGNSRFASSTRDRDNSTEEKEEEEEVVSVRKKRARNEHGGSVYDRFLEAVRDNPSRVFYVEDVDEFDRGCVRGFERAMKEGSVSSVGDGGEALLLKDAIVIFSCDHGQQKNHDDQNQCGSLDLNVATINEDGNSSLSGIPILDSVHMQVVFRIQVL